MAIVLLLAPGRYEHPYPAHLLAVAEYHGDADPQYLPAPMPRGSITAAKSGNPDERYGARVRFKYFFDRAARNFCGVRRGRVQTGRLAHRAAQNAVILALEVSAASSTDFLP